MDSHAGRGAWVPVVLGGAGALGLVVYALRPRPWSSMPLAFWGGVVAFVLVAIVVRQRRVGLLEGAAILGALHLVLALGALECGWNEHGLDLSRAGPVTMSDALTASLWAHMASWWLAGVLALVAAVALLPHGPIRWLVIVASGFTIPVMIWVGVLCGDTLEHVGPRVLIIPAASWALGVWAASGHVARSSIDSRVPLARLLAAIGVACAGGLIGVSSFPSGYGMRYRTRYETALLVRDRIGDAHDLAWLGVSIGVALALTALIGFTRTRERSSRSSAGVFALFLACVSLAWAATPRSQARLWVAVADHAVEVERRPPDGIPSIHARTDAEEIAFLHVRSEIEEPDAELHLDARGVVRSHEYGHLLRVYAPGELPFDKLVTAIDRVADARADLFELRLVPDQPR